MTAEAMVAALGLAVHPEGGWYRETWRSDATLPTKEGRGRACATAILFLLSTGQPSRLHRLDAEEVWLWQGGAALTVHVIHQNGAHEAIRVGPDIAAGERLQAVVPPGVWFGSEVEPDGACDWALVGCVVSPGFEFEGFELAEREGMLEAYPGCGEVVGRLA